MINSKSFCVLVGLTATTILGSSASATTYRLQPASGQPFLTSATARWDVIHNQANFEVLDGRSVGLVASSGTWVTPIPIDSTNATWEVRQFRTNGTGTVSTRICSFTSAGLFSACSSSTTSNNVGVSVTVPSDGTAYAQSYFDNSCRDDCELTMLHTIRAAH